VYPILYNGTTYLPVRAISGLVDLPVDWDGDTRTVILGSSSAVVGVRLIDGARANRSDFLAATVDVDTFPVLRDDFDAVSRSYSFALKSNNTSGWATKYTLNSAYGKLFFSLGTNVASTESRPLTVKFTDTSSSTHVVLKEFRIEANQLLTDLEVNLSGITSFEISVHGNGNQQVFILEPYLIP